jgi:hypothetical protein
MTNDKYTRMLVSGLAPPGTKGAHEGHIWVPPSPLNTNAPISTGCRSTNRVIELVQYVKALLMALTWTTTIFPDGWSEATWWWCSFVIMRYLISLEDIVERTDACMQLTTIDDDGTYMKYTWIHDDRKDSSVRACRPFVKRAAERTHAN